MIAVRRRRQLVYLMGWKTDHVLDTKTVLDLRPYTAGDDSENGLYINRQTGSDDRLVRGVLRYSRCDTNTHQSFLNHLRREYGFICQGVYTVLKEDP